MDPATNTGNTIATHMVAKTAVSEASLFMGSS